MWYSYHVFKCSLLVLVVVILFTGTCFSVFKYFVCGQYGKTKWEDLSFNILKNPWNLEMKYMAFFDLKDDTLCMKSSSTKSVCLTWKYTVKTAYTLMVVKRGVGLNYG